MRPTLLISACLLCAVSCSPRSQSTLPVDAAVMEEAHTEEAVTTNVSAPAPTVTISPADSPRTGNPKEHIGGTPVSPLPDDKTSDRLLRAAEELEAAGLLEEANHYRTRAQTKSLEEKAALLPQREAELARLQSEVDELRRNTGAMHQVLLEVVIFEIDRTGIAEQKIELPWEAEHFLTSSKKEETCTSRLFDAGTIPWRETIDLLRDQSVLKFLAEPKIVTVSGRRATFNASYLFPALVSDLNVPNPVDYRRFGTEVDLLPHKLGVDRLELDFHVRIAQMDHAREVVVDGKNVPGLRVREIKSSAELKYGQTLIMGGLKHMRFKGKNESGWDDSDLAANARGGEPTVSSDETGITATSPGRSVDDGQLREIECLFIVTPHLVEPMDPPSPPLPIAAPRPVALPR